MAGKIERVVWKGKDLVRGIDFNQDLSGVSTKPYMVNLLPVGDTLLRRRFGYALMASLSDSDVVYMYQPPGNSVLFTISAAGIIRCYTISAYNPLTFSGSVVVGTLGGGYASWGLVQMCSLTSGAYVVAAAGRGIYTCAQTAASLSAVVTALPNAGNCVVWQNKVWAGSTDGHIYWSNAGLPGTWTVGTDFNWINEIDNSAITALGAGSGFDVIAQSQLNVFKAGSWYRVINSTTGEYQTMSSTHGALGGYSVTNLDGATYFGNNAGLYELKPGGVTSHVISGSQKMASNSTAGGVVANGEYIVLTRGSTNHWVYHPRTGGWYPMQGSPAGHPYLANMVVHNMWLDGDGAIGIDTTGLLFAYPPPPTGVPLANSYGYADLQNKDGSANYYAAALYLPPLQSEGRKIRYRNLYWRGRMSTVNTPISVSVYSDPAIRDYGTSTAIQRNYQSNEAHVERTKTYSSLGAWRQAQISLQWTFGATEANPIIIDTNAYGYGSSTSRLPSLEISEVGLEIVRLGR